MTVTHIRAFLALVIKIVAERDTCGQSGVGVINRQLLSVSNVHQTLKLILDYDKRISASFVSLNPLNTLDCHYIVKISV